MEFDERKIKPESTRKCLQHQVEEQSDVCDITVKMGQWERKYHRCVLMASPFFECALKNDFLEKYSGTIRVSCGTPTSVDDALMFLYGKQPKLNDKNIEVMIDLAEFFMIPNLKSACVSWLGKQQISEENCLSRLHLSSQYGFELSQCTEYFESHLHEVLLLKPTLHLTFESLLYIFTENKFCYLQMEDRLRFLVRWYAAQSETRKMWTEKLLESIAFEDIPMSCLNEMKRDHMYEQLLQNVNVGLEDTHELTDVLISITYDKLLCFDLARDTWFKIKTATLDQLFLRAIESLADTNPDVSELYLTECDFDGLRLNKVNLKTDEIKTYQIVTNENEAVHKSNHFHFSNNVCVICKSERVETKRSDQTSSSLNERMRLLSPLLGPINEPTFFHLLLHSTARYRDTTLVLIGKITGEKVRMVPQFSLADSEVSSVAVNNDSVIALISRTYVFLYDTVGCTMDKVELKTEYGDKIFPAENGFVMHNNERCITIMRLSGQALSNRYEAKEYVLGDKQYGDKKFFYCNNTWFGYFRESYDSEYHFKCVDHKKIEEASSPDNVVWKELSLPKEPSACSSPTLGETMHLIRLPRRLLRCHLDCPHCKAGKQRSTAARTSGYDLDDCYYDDSDSDDDVFVSYGMYDSDDDYYYGSD